jgi:hypothetical protein
MPKCSKPPYVVEDLSPMIPKALRRGRQHLPRQWGPEINSRKLELKKNGLSYQ